MTAPIQRRLDALEHRNGAACLSCELAKLSSNSEARCTHPAWRTLRDEIVELDTFNGQPHVEH